MKGGGVLAMARLMDCMSCVQQLFKTYISLAVLSLSMALYVSHTHNYVITATFVPVARLEGHVLPAVLIQKHAATATGRTR